jgi:MATE family multidrug resistance protein
MFSIIKGYIPYYKRNLKIAIPVIIAHAGQVTVSMADNIMVGRVNAMELAAISFAGAVYSIGMVFGMGFAIGVTPMIGISYGGKDFRKVASYFQNALLLNLIFTMLCLCLMFLIGSFFDQMGQEESVIIIAKPVYYMLVLSFLPQMIFFSGRHFAEGIGNTKIAMYITISGNILNIFLNYLLIFGKFGCPALGAYGAAIATCVSRSVMALGFIGIFCFNHSFRRYFLFFSKTGFLWVRIKELIRISMPVALQIGMEIFAFAFCAIMVGWVDGNSLAAHQIALSMASFTFMIVLGISSATTIRVSHQLGAGNFVGARKAGFSSMHLAIGFMSITAICFILFRNHIPLLFNSDPQVVAFAAKLFIAAGIFQIFDGLQAVSMAALRGLADTAKPMLISFISYIIVCMSVGYILAFIVGLDAFGIWLGFVVGLVLAATWLSLRFYKKSKQILNASKISPI